MSFSGKHPAQLALELDAVLPAIATKAKLQSLCVDIDIRGERVSRAYREDARPVVGDERPVYAAGCLADVFLAVLCLELHRTKGLDLDAPFDRYVPELAPLNPPGAEPITVRHLITRTGGLQDPRSIAQMRTFVPWTELGPMVAGTRRMFSPGAVFNYAGIERVIMMVLIERFSGMSLYKISQTMVVDPCGVGARENQYGAPEADGYVPIVKFDTYDFLTIVANLAREGDDRRPNPFSSDLRYFLQLERVPLSRSIKAQPWPHAATSFTFGLFKYSNGLFGFNGWEDNQSCGVRYDPLSEVSFVVALEGPPHLRDVILGEIAQRLGYVSVQSRASPCTIGGLNGLRPEEIVGSYSGWADGYRAEVSIEGGEVACELNYRGDTFQRVSARLEENEWLVVDSVTRAAALEFFRDFRADRVCMATGFLPYAMDRAPNA